MIRQNQSLLQVTRALSPQPKSPRLFGKRITIVGKRVKPIKAEGLSNKEIASRLMVGLHAIKWHTGNIYGKLNVKSRTQAVAKARLLNIIPAKGK